MRVSITPKVILMLIGYIISASVSGQEISYPPQALLWNADSLGTHRAVIHVEGNEPNAKGTILWRMHSLNPDHKLMFLVDAASETLIHNVVYNKVSNEGCEITFQRKGDNDTYFLYYMPYRRHKGSENYPQNFYPEAHSGATVEWIQEVQQTNLFARASLQNIESVDSFNSFYPMEVVATAEETRQLINKNSERDYLVFPEDRTHVIKMNKNLPLRWIRQGPQNSFQGSAEKGEYYAFQLGVFADKKDLKNVKVTFSDLKNGSESFSKKLLTCINTNGVDYKGNPVNFQVDISKGNIQSLWCYIQIPENAQAGNYSGFATLKPGNAPETKIDVNIQVLDVTIENHGVDEPWNMTRLPWLNSILGQENTVIAPYTQIKTDGNSLSILGREVRLQDNGLPLQIQTYFPIEMTSLSAKPQRNILASPIDFKVLDVNHNLLPFKVSGSTFTKKSEGTVEWQSKMQNNQLELLVKGHLEFDGFLSYTLRLVAKDDVTLGNVQLLMPVDNKVAEYFMGLGNKGGNLSENIHWKWDVAQKNQEGGWIGTVNAGFRFSLRDQNYERPLNTNFYLQKPLKLPISWGNDNKGGINIDKKKTNTLVNAYSGARQMKKGDTLYFNFNLLITPFHALDVETHWKNRYFHAYKPIDSIKAQGANVINVHQGNYINPYINYPFIATGQMKSYIDSAHRAGMKVKIYNTIRELANRAYELDPLFSLGHEIFPSGKGGGYPWLQEHLNGDYIAGWYTPETNDAAIVNGGASRWHNYYIEGLKWLVHNVGIDGLYLDDVAFDRITMKRVKRELLQDDHPGLIDLHSANQHDKSDGWNNSAILYMSLFPYINRLWFGEYFDYENNGPDFFLTEVSGIPFGLMGEMLQDGGNTYRGMVYGMTSRLPWTGGDPKPMWKLWDDFGIEQSKMIGYWVPDNPVKTDNKNVKATIFWKKGKMLIALASWAEADTTVRLKIDWKKLGLNPRRTQLIAPKMVGLQMQQNFPADALIPVSKNKGIILMLE